MLNGNDYVDRSYRTLQAGSDLRYFRVRVKETDLAIGIDNDSYDDSLIALCENEIRRLRAGLEAYIDVHPEFRSALAPLDLLPGAPPIAVSMGKAGWQAGVGPMAAVRAFAEAVVDLEREGQAGNRGKWRRHLYGHLQPSVGFSFCRPIVI